MYMYMSYRVFLEPFIVAIFSSNKIAYYSRDDFIRLVLVRTQAPSLYMVACEDSAGDSKLTTSVCASHLAQFLRPTIAALAAA